MKNINALFLIINKRIHKILTILGIKFKKKNEYKDLKCIIDANNNNTLKSIQMLNSSMDELKETLEDDFSKKFNLYNSQKENLKKEYKNKIILFDYKFIKVMKNWGVNLGDYIQTIAVKNVIFQLNPNIDTQYIDRDSLTTYSGSPAFAIMQGWFAHDFHFIPNNNILPIWIGTHIANHKKRFLAKFINYNPSYFANITIGCRDKNTVRILSTLGIKSYFSRCLTLTLPKRDKKNSQNKIFLVNVPDEYLEYIPNEILNNAEFINQRQIDSNLDYSDYFNTREKYENEAMNLLEKYRNEAKLIITSALHCTCPCIAMGIPVVLISPKENDPRFSVLDGILKVYSKKDLENNDIDFNPKTFDIEDLKKLMLKNVELSIKEAFDEDYNKDELLQVRQKIEKYNVLDKANLCVGVE